MLRSLFLRHNHKRKDRYYNIIKNIIKIKKSNWLLIYNNTQYIQYLKWRMEIFLNNAILY